MVKKNFDDMYNCLVTDRQTDILPRHSPRYAYASRGKNWTLSFENSHPNQWRWSAVEVGCATADRDHRWAKYQRRVDRCASSVEGSGCDDPLSRNFFYFFTSKLGHIMR